MAASDAKPFPKKNEAYRVTFPIFDADGDLVSGATGLDSEISKDGGSFADCTNEATEIATSSGIYYLDLTSTEMNADTVAIIIKTSTSGAKTTPIIMYPVENGDIPVDVRQIEGADPSDTIRDAVVDDSTRIDASALNTLSGHDPGATLSSLTTAQVNAEVDTALADIHLDHLLAADYDPASKPGVATALLNELVESDAGVSRFTANALEQAPTGGSAPTAAQIADAVWDEALADHNTEDSFGNVLNDLVDEDGGGVYQFNSNALELAPTGSGSGDWTSDEKEQIRYRLQLDGTQAAPAADAPLQMPVSADAISQDETAADNLEAMLDGTRAKLYLSGLDIEANGDDDAIKAIGGGTGAGILAYGGANDGHGMDIRANNGNSAAGIAHGINLTGFAAISASGRAIGIVATGESTGIYSNVIVGNITGNLSGSIGSLATQAKADVNAEMDAALADVNLDHLAGTATGIPAVPAGTYLDQIMDDGTASYDRTTDSLQAIADNAASAGLTAQEVRNAMELASTAGATEAGSIDAQLVDITGKIGTPVALDGGTATVSGMLTKLADDSEGAVYNAETDSQAAIAAAGVGGASAGEIADAVWDESTGGHNSAGTFGLLNINAAQIGDLEGAQDYLDSLISAVSAKVGTPISVDGSAATIAAMLLKIFDDNGGADYDASNDSLNAYFQNTISELGAGQAPATPTLKQAIMLLYMALRNDTEIEKTGSNTGVRRIKNDTGTTILEGDINTSASVTSKGKLQTP